ncbi:MAG: 50S ribosomal protein L30 [bacterium]
MPKTNKLKATWIHSAIGRSYRQKRIIEALGFKRLNQTRELADNAATRGMLKKVPHLVVWEEINEKR